MKPFLMLFMGGRSFYRNMSRFRVLLAALIFVIGVFTVIFGAVSGMITAVQDKAARYFSGHLTVQQVFLDSYPKILQPASTTTALAPLLGDVSLMTKRSVYYNAGQAELFFGGNSQRQRRLIGVDWQHEQSIMAGLDYKAGSAPGDDDATAILVSTITADALGLLLGDEVVIRLSTQTGSINSSTYVVHGIFYESSFFGFSSYLQREALNSLMAVDTDSVNEIGLYLRQPRDMARVGGAVSATLASLGQVFPVLLNRQQRDTALSSSGWNNGQFLITSLDAQLAEIHNLIRALWAIGVVLVVLFGVLVIIGISNTYSFLVLERTSEIGTMRAIGMSKSRVLGMFLSESLFLGVIGLSLGVLGGCAMLEFLRLAFDFSGSDLASLFLVRGRLNWDLEPYHITLLFILGLVSVIAGSFRAAWRAAQLSPVDALRHA